MLQQFVFSAFGNTDLGAQPDAYHSRGSTQGASQMAGADFIGTLRELVGGNEQLSPLIDMLEGYLHEHERLKTRNSLLAAALGACECWADDHDCDVCDGVGRPGWDRPDKQCFDEFVRPAILSMRKRAPRRHPPTVIEYQTNRGV